MPEPAEGQVPAGDYKPVVEEPVWTEATESTEGAKSNEEVAKEVVAGHWGRGQDRNKRLRDAGYDPLTINSEIVKLYNR
jgi:CW_7 repeat